ncbi:AAA ATPase-like domain-containing protein [Desulfonema limicola]|uniref:AAA ATPase-like domain-containing protein n=1 Tax=Desulfonema limicola TaxID=45656 RepID=A0A975GGR4_9BACT|nr:AAA family ATPase [Desulfonema limicola]QTA80472.1 AAA ATPase-like domain-containing protein [Desulfonema limicola]
MNPKKLPIGLSDFKELIKEKFYYIDKTNFIRDIIISPSKILLFPRPRRFGKTLNLSMLRYFFEKNDKDTGFLFKGLEIEKHEVFKTCQGKYPVIYMTFKDVKHLDWLHCLSSIKYVVYEEFSKHRYLLESNAIYKEDKVFFQNVLERSLPEEDYHNALKLLSRCLHSFYNTPVLIFIDEYDTPIHAAYASGYYKQIISFMRNFLSGGMKDNPYLFKGVLTGILRVAKESVFSGLNNLGVHTLLSLKFSDSFGFTKDETVKLLRDYNMKDHFQEVSNWYDGYKFGKSVIYNPWSVLNYIYNQGVPDLYWVNTADTGMIDKLATRGGKKLREEIGQLLEGKCITKQIYDSIVMNDLDNRDDILWSFLLFCGYLKVDEKKSGINIYRLAVPNREIRYIYEEMVKRWFGEKIESECLENFVRALNKGDVKLFEIMLRKVVLQVMSYHDLSGEPERVYHALVLGMLVWMSDAYEIRSNRESGYGRYDIMLKPRDLNKHGIIIEFKMVEDDEKPEQTLKRAMEQIEKKKYTAELEASGVKDIIKIAIAFKGKELWLEHELYSC